MRTQHFFAFLSRLFSFQSKRSPTPFLLPTSALDNPQFTSCTCLWFTWDMALHGKERKRRQSNLWSYPAVNMDEYFSKTGRTTCLKTHKSFVGTALKWQECNCGPDVNLLLSIPYAETEHANFVFNSCMTVIEDQTERCARMTYCVVSWTWA